MARGAVAADPRRERTHDRRPAYRVDAMQVRLEPRQGSGAPVVVATLDGTVDRSRPTGGSPTAVERAATPRRFSRRSSSRSRRPLQDHATSVAAAAPTSRRPAPAAGADRGAWRGVRLTDVAAQVGLDFRHGAFRFGMSLDVTAMMGGGLCWLDYDDDGWLDLFVVNSYSDVRHQLAGAAWRPATQRPLPQRATARSKT